MPSATYSGRVCSHLDSAHNISLSFLEKNPKFESMYLLVVEERREKKSA